MYKFCVWERGGEEHLNGKKQLGTKRNNIFYQINGKKIETKKNNMFYQINGKKRKLGTKKNSVLSNWNGRFLLHNFFVQPDKNFLFDPFYSFFSLYVLFFYNQQSKSLSNSYSLLFIV